MILAEEEVDPRDNGTPQPADIEQLNSFEHPKVCKDTMIQKPWCILYLPSICNVKVLDQHVFPCTLRDCVGGRFVEDFSWVSLERTSSVR